MKFVSLVLTVMLISFGASAQTTRNASEKSAIAQAQKKTKFQKAKSSRTKAAAAKNSEVTTLTDERTYKAKWTFEEMLKRRMEIDAEKGERGLRKE